MPAFTGFDWLVNEYGDHAAELLWEGALAMVDRAVARLREDREHARFRSTPRSQVRYLRRELGMALRVARLAIAVREDVEERDRELDDDLRAAAAARGAQERRKRTREAERVRRIKGRVRRLHGREATREELYGPGGILNPSEPRPQAEDVTA